jgi:hypothetical protein
MHRHRFSDAGVNVIVVSFMQSPELAVEWSDQVGAGFLHCFSSGADGAAGPMYTDAFRFRRSVAGVWSQESLGFYAAQKALGRELESSHGQDVNQLAGDVVIGADGTVRLAYYSRNNTDRPSLDMLAEAACGSDTPPPASPHSLDCGARALFEAASATQPLPECLSSERREGESLLEGLSTTPNAAVVDSGSGSVHRDAQVSAGVVVAGAFVGACLGAMLALSLGLGRRR